MSQDDQEIWFIRMGWSHTPCHWKGWAVLLAVLAPTAAAVALLSWLSSRIGGALSELMPILPIFVALFVMDRVAKTRSKPWR